jgi:hypothetical protein
MSKLRMGTEDQMELLASLEALLGCVKALHTSVGTVMKWRRCASPFLRIRQKPMSISKTFAQRWPRPILRKPCGRTTTWLWRSRRHKEIRIKCLAVM